MDSKKLYTIPEIPDKGLGLVAAVNIAKGTRIISEAPLLLVAKTARSMAKLSKSLSKDVAALSDANRQAFYSLHNAFEDEMTRELGIVRTNALPLGAGASMGGIFIESSHINHACVQNAQNTWNEGLEQLTIHAVREIEKGEEITIIYLQDHLNRDARQRILQQEFRFICSCRLCRLPPDQQGPSDARLDEIQRLDQAIGDGIRISSSPLQALHDVHKLLQLYKEEGIADASVPRAYYDAFQIAAFHSDKARARVFAERSSATRMMLEGDDSPAVRRVKDLATDPTRHRSYGNSSQWSNSISENPSDLPPAAFESWLWKKGKWGPQEQSQFADLRDDGTFPSFGGLPDENGVDLQFFESEDGQLYRPRKHWCFLAEIVTINDFLRLSFFVKDKTGQRTQIMFYTDSRGRELDISLVREGFTVALLYPEQHGFLDMSVGIRHEHPRVLKIFPVALQELLALSDKVQLYASEVEGERACHGCRRKAKTLRKCGRCNLFGYCDKACQTISWNERGHKGDCKLLRDADLRLLLVLDQGPFKQHHAFSNN